MTEQKLQSKILNYLKSRPDTWVVKTIAVNIRGCPDILACIDGRFVAIEVKAPGKLSTVTPLQNYQIDQIQAAGGFAVAVDSLEKLKEKLEEKLNVYLC